MKNGEIADIFYQIADFLEMGDGDNFRIYAYRKAAAALNSLEEDIEALYCRDGVEGLEKISGIGKSTALLIKEYLEKGEIGYYRALKKKTPVDLAKMVRIEGVGPKTVKILYRELGVKNIKDLKKAARESKIAGLFNFGKKKEQKILEGIKFLEGNKEVFLLKDVLFEARIIEKKIRAFSETKKANIAGSLRRGKEIVHDLDFLIASQKSDKTIKELLSLPGITRTLGKGKTKVSVKTQKGFNIDFRIVKPESYGSALQYFTGSKEHNIQLRKKAIKKGLKINEYGVFEKKKKIGGRTEDETYGLLGIKKAIPPEMREGAGEIEAALSGRLPGIVELKDIKGDFHCHTNWSGGKNTIEEMAREAKKLGYKYIGIADHTKFLKIENGLDEKELERQGREIAGLNAKIRNFKILQGCEANIMKDGSLDISDCALKKLDFVIAGVHSHFKMNKEEMTERMIKAIKNPLVDIIAHPLGRILEKRRGYQIDFEKILKIARETKTILEINACPRRLDLNDSRIRRAKEEKVKMAIDSDAHHEKNLKFMEFGVFQARRGWAEKKDILNCEERPFFPKRSKDLQLNPKGC